MNENDFPRFQQGMTVTPAGNEVTGYRGTKIRPGQILVIAAVFEDEGILCLNLQGIRDAFGAKQFVEVRRTSALALA